MLTRSLFLRLGVHRRLTHWRIVAHAETSGLIPEYTIAWIDSE